MKILHICLGSNFTDGLTYQENYLVKENLKDGHEVLLVTNDLYFKDGKECKSSEINKIIHLEDNYSMIRLSFDNWIPLKQKVRKTKGLYKIIDNFSPNLILFHGICSYELLTCKKYLKKHRNVRLLLDTHADQYNSGTNILSKLFIHKIMYKFFYKRVEKYVEKILFIDENSEAFMINHYHVDKRKCVYFPLGGKVKDDNEYYTIREKYRNQLNVTDEIVIFHSGKFNKIKKTMELINCYLEVERDDLILVIAGIFDDEIRTDAMEKINLSNKIIYLDWVNNVDLDGYLCACDVYAQPGSQSATFELALCNRSPAIVYPYDNYTRFYSDNIYTMKDIKDLRNILLLLEQGELHEKGLISFVKAKDNLDYTNIVKKMY